MSVSVRLGEDPCIERAPQLCIRREGVMPAKSPSPSYVVIKKDRFARWLARAEAFDASHCHVPPWFRRQLPLGHEHWAIALGGPSLSGDRQIS